jgi:hypothetical protein
MTKWQTRQALYLLGLTGILYLFSCKSQDILIKTSMNLRNVFVFLYKKVIYLTNERQTCKVLLFILIKV